MANTGTGTISARPIAHSAVRQPAKYTNIFGHVKPLSTAEPALPFAPTSRQEVELVATRESILCGQIEST
jgi:hypothetical protein